MMSLARRVTLLGGTLSFAAQAGCYAYQPSPLPALAPTGQRVRVHLTADGTSELARYLGPRVAAVDGLLTGRQPDGALTLGVEAVRTQDGVRLPWSGEGIVSFPAAYVTGVDVNTLDRQKSVLGAVALAAGIIAVSVAALKVSGSQPGGGTGPGTPP